MSQFAFSDDVVHAQRGGKVKLVTMRIQGQLFGIPVDKVQDVLRAQKVARVPLAPPEIFGSINLRGRIVTVLNMRKRLGLPPREDDAASMFVVVEHQNEHYSLMVDAVGDVVDIPESDIQSTPPNLDSQWRDIATGIWRTKDDLLVVVDVARVIQL